MVKLLLYKVLMLDVDVIQFLYHLQQFVLLHNYCIKKLIQLYLLQEMAQQHKGYIFRLLVRHVPAGYG